MAGVNDLQLNTTITLKDEFTSHMSSFSSSIGRLHGMLESLNKTMNNITHTISTPMSNNFSKGLTEIGRSSHRANIELNALNTTLTRTIALSSRLPSGGVGRLNLSPITTGSRGLGAISGYRGILGSIIRGLNTVNSMFLRSLGSINAIFLRGLGSVLGVALRGFGASRFGSSSLSGGFGASRFGSTSLSGGVGGGSSTPKTFNGFGDFLKNNLITALVGAFGSMAVLKQAQKLFEDANKNMTIQQRLSNLDFVTKGDISIDELKEKIFGASVRSKTNYLDFADMVQQIGVRADTAFGSSGELVQFTEQLQKLFTTAGMGSSERTNTTLVLTRALENGKIESRELRSMFKNAPEFLNRIEKIMGQNLNSDTDVTTDVIKKAVLSDIDEVNKKFEEVPDSWSEVMIRINNYTAYAFQSVYQKISNIFDGKRIQKLTEKVAPIIFNIASILEKVIDRLTKVIDWVLDNFEPLMRGISDIVTILGTVIGLITTINFLMATGPIGLIIVTITALEVLIQRLNVINGTTDTIIGFIAYGLGYIWSEINNLVIRIMNIGKTIGVWLSYAFFKIVNYAKISALGWQSIYVKVVNEIRKVIINTFSNIFKFIVKGVKDTVTGLLEIINFGLLYPLSIQINGLLSLFRSIAKIKINGKEIISSNLIPKDISFHLDTNKATSGLSNVIDNITKSNNNLINGINKETQNAFSLLGKDAQKLFGNDKRLDETYKFLQDSLNISLNNSGKEANKWKDWANLNLNPFNSLMQSNGNFKDLREISTGFNKSFDNSKVLNDIKKNTDDIRNNSDFSKYLRELADRQSINHFTSPTYSINLENQNTINSQADYNGFVTRIVDEIKEALLNSPQSIPYGGAYA